MSGGYRIGDRGLGVSRIALYFVAISNSCAAIDSSRARCAHMVLQLRRAAASMIHREATWQIAKLRRAH